MKIADILDGGSSTEESLTLNAGDADSISLPEGFPLTEVTFEASGDDLVVTAPDGTQVVIEDYYGGDAPPELTTPDGVQISGDVVGELAGDVEQAAAPAEAGEGDAELAAGTDSAGSGDGGGLIADNPTVITGTDGEPIGNVENLSGTVWAIRTDGTKIELNVGDPVYQGDILESGPDGAVGVLLADETTFSMAENGRMVLDEMIYDPATEDDSVSLSVLQGVFTFVSGQVAKTDPDAMTLDTPVATIGIRGTQVGIEIPDGENLNVVLMEEADGFVGEVVVLNDAGSQVLNNANQFTLVQSFDLAPTEIQTVEENDMVENFAQALQHLPLVHGNQNDFGMQEGGEEEFLDEEIQEIEEDVENLDEFDTAAGEEEPVDEGPEQVEITVQCDVEFDPFRNIVGGTVGDEPEPEEVEVEDEPEEEEVEEVLPPTDDDGRILVDVESEFTGGEAAEAITGSSGVDIIDGGGDIINAGADDDTVGGGTGDDFIDGGEGDDVLGGGEGDDVLFGTEGDDVLLGTEGNDDLTVAAIDVPLLEDTAFDLDASGAFEKLLGKGAQVISISGEPKGATLLDGAGQPVDVDNGDGTWTLSAVTETTIDPQTGETVTTVLTPLDEVLDGLTITPAENSDEDFSLWISGYAGNGTPIDEASMVDMVVTGVADTPNLEVGDVVGPEDTFIPLDVSANLTDTDGSETLSVTIAGVPEGAALSAGTITSVNPETGEQTWTLTADALVGLAVTPPLHSDVDFPLSVTVTNTEDDGDSISQNFDMNVTVEAVADTPDLGVADATSFEDTGVPLSISPADLVDTDGSESLSITISGVPDGASLSAGTDNGDGSWTFVDIYETSIDPETGEEVSTLVSSIADQLSGLTLSPPTDSNEDFTLTLTAALGDPVANGDGEVLEPDRSITYDLDISSALTDTDAAQGRAESETLSVTLGGVPDGVVFSAGVKNDDGTWTLGPGDLAGLQMTVGGTVNDDFNVTATAIRRRR